jgi:hypothetical protein
MQFKVTADNLNVRKTPKPDGVILGALNKNDIVESLGVSDDKQWVNIKTNTLTGWSFFSFLQPVVQDTSTAGIARIITIASSSAISKFKWTGRGMAPMGYIKGMALVFARAFCNLKAGDGAALEMAKANTGNAQKDALAHYAQRFSDAGMSNEANGVDTLRHLFVLQIGLGMRESSGRYCEGRDTTADNVTAATAEAGLFQASFNARSASKFMDAIFQKYLAAPNGFLDIFKEGVKCSEKNLENFGTGDGLKYQKLTKECPAFAAEFAAVGLRNIRTHWGPINRRDAEIRPECDKMLLQVQHAVDESNLCPI